jgi:hypothetical protein
MLEAARSRDSASLHSAHESACQYGIGQGFSEFSGGSDVCSERDVSGALENAASAADEKDCSMS